MKITSKIKRGLAALAVVIAGAVMVAPMPVEAANKIYCPNGKESTDGTLVGCEDGTGKVKTDQNANNLMELVGTIINFVVGAVGLVAVVVIILGGVQYTTSAGDAAKVTKAKNTIMYGVIGLVVAMLAFAIVNFVLSSLKIS